MPGPAAPPPTPDAAPPVHAGARPRARWTASLVSVLVLAALAWGLILAGHDRDRGRYDQINYHQPAILKMAEEWPAPALDDYLTATTPGYHLVLATVARWIDDSTATLQFTGSLFSLGLAALLGRWLAPRAGTVAATLLVLGVFSSLYVFSATVFVLPDNAAWLGVAAMLMLAMRGRQDPAFFLGGGVILAALVFTRQTHIWAAAMLWIAAWLGPQEDAGPWDRPRASLGRALPAVAASLPAFGVVLWFYLMWSGLAPPIYQRYMQSVNPATPAVILAQVGVIGVWHAGYWGPPLLAALRSRRWFGPVAAVVAAGVVAGLPATTLNRDAGRSSGLWNYVPKLPVLGEHTSVLVLGLACLGAVALTGWWMGLRRRDRWVLAVALAAFSAAMSMNANAWPRYHEPFVLMLAALASAGVASARGSVVVAGWVRWLRWAGLAGLMLMLAWVTVQKARQEPRAVLTTSHPDAARPLTDLWPRAWLEEGPPAEVLGGTPGWKGPVMPIPGGASGVDGVNAE